MCQGRLRGPPWRGVGRQGQAASPAAPSILAALWLIAAYTDFVQIFNDVQQVAAAATKGLEIAGMGITPEHLPLPPSMQLIQSS